MNTQTNWKTLIMGLIGAINAILIAAGIYHLDDQALQALDLTVSAGLTIFGVFKSHTVKTDQTKTPSV